MMFSIKLVSPEHLAYPFFSQDYTDGRKTLMNFSKESAGRAKSICRGDKAIVYVNEQQKFVWLSSTQELSLMVRLRP
jgi:hypothetical protein